jgi:hypothetical protein
MQYMYMLTVIFVLIDPRVALLSLNHQLVVAETGVDKRVDECARQVASCGVDVRSRAST